MISVVILAKNEEAMLPGALKSVAWADEIIVGVDKTTTDDTAKIAKTAGAKVLGVDVTKGFASAKNTLINAAEQEWILILDADERVTSALRTEIETRVSILDKATVGLEIPFTTYMLGQRMDHGGWQHDKHIRLIRSGKGSYTQQEIHETISLDGKIGQTQATIEHYTHRTISSIVQKVDYYSDFEAKLLAANFPWPTKARHIVLPALKHFGWRYIRQQGYKDGIPGLIESTVQCFYIFLNNAKAWELVRAAKERSER